MKTRRTSKSVFLLLIILVIVLAVWLLRMPRSSGAQPDWAAFSPDTPVAYVNGEPLPYRLLEYAVAEKQAAVIMIGEMQGEALPFDLEEERPVLLEELMLLQALAGIAAEQGIAISPEEAEQIAREELVRPYEANPGDTLGQYAGLLRQQLGWSEEELLQPAAQVMQMRISAQRMIVQLIEEQQAGGEAASYEAVLQEMEALLASTNFADSAQRTVDVSADRLEDTVKRQLYLVARIAG